MDLMLDSRERQIRMLGAAAGYRSLRALLVAAGLSRSSFALTLRDGRAPRSRTLAKLAAALGVTEQIVARILRAEAGDTRVSLPAESPTRPARKWRGRP